MKKNIRSFIIYFSLNLIFFLIILFSVIAVDLEHKHSIADAAVNLTRENFIIGDFRSVSKDIGKIRSGNFSKIEIRGKTSDLMTVDSDNPTELSLSFKKAIWSDLDHSHLKGYFIFYVGVIHSLLTSLKILFATMFITAPCFILLEILLRKRQKQNLENEKAKILIELTKQVAHDIRSPLSALNMVTTSLNTLPEDERILIRNAISRINDISNDLLQKGKQENRPSNNQQSEENNKTIELIPTLVDVLVSEKRMQYREFSGLRINVEFKNSFGAFAQINSRELKRVISNLINNSVEAFDDNTGEIKIVVEKTNQQIEISIIDNGKGIPSHLLEKVGEQGLSFGKASSNKSGSGLGLYHAKQTIEQLGGKIEIDSAEGIGTTIKLILNLEDSPSWFADNIDLSNKTLVVSLDDDSSVHQIWANRLSYLNKVQSNKVVHKQFQSGELFKIFVKENISDISQTQFLIDFELLNQTKTGLDIIEELDLAKHSILVTSRYEEKSVQTRAYAIDLKILPKALAGEVPIIQAPVEREKAKIKYDLVLLDDDPLVRMTWEIKAKQKNKSIKIFTTSAELWDKLDEIDKESSLYIDVHLAHDESGVDISKQLFDLGFLNLYLATGYEPDNFHHITWVKGIVGKNPI